MSSAAPTASDAAREQAFRLADRVNRRPWAARLLTAAHRHRTDLMVALVWAVLAGWLTHGLWPDPGSRTLALNPEDQTLYEWFLAVDARALLGDFDLLTDRLNAPDGVNLMANTTVIALGVVCSPVTLLLGAPVTFALLAAANLAGTALAWYLLFHRTLRARRLAAALGGGLCGFGPGMVSQTNSHLHMTAQWLVPVIIWLVVRLLRASDPGPATLDVAGQARTTGPGRRRIMTSAAGLAAAVTAQVFIGEEVLFLAAITLLVMAISYAVTDRDLARRALPNFTAGLAVAAGLALLVLGYPLWFQFAGPQGVADGMFTPAYFSADLSSWWTVSPLSVVGSDESARLTTGPAEYNTFLGWPLLLAAVACAIWVGRRRLVFACVVAGLVMGALSLGPEVVLGGTKTAIPGPYALIGGLPVVDGALPMRFALALLPIVATVLVLAVDRALAGAGRARRLVPVAVGVALIPIFPTPLPTTGRPAVPEFVTGGHWRQCVRPGGVLVPVPLPTPKEPWPMRWATAADAGFGLPEGFFIGPYGRGGTAAMGTFKQPTSALLADVARRGDQPAIGDEQRRQAARDVDFWGASCVALADDAPHADSLRSTLEQLYGPGTRIADAWTWRV
ncbi:hypothetical protein [Micromonospora tarensis]|uniref:4-amino-4-deoxy-L-arabinose transferase n=1 Tax=Micromonospora tarensis TaxID=2806100 RepID=A0ABS1YBS0_9ACTN|nr:hypothetical protein [Micromonospora tarensis]MBM0274754.1 hypothetical protein [Micromonospora tarensis]